MEKSNGISLKNIKLSYVQMDRQGPFTRIAGTESSPNMFLFKFLSSIFCLQLVASLTSPPTTTTTPWTSAAAAVVVVVSAVLCCWPLLSSSLSHLLLNHSVLSVYLLWRVNVFERVFVNRLVYMCVCL